MTRMGKYEGRQRCSYSGSELLIWTLCRLTGGLDLLTLVLLDLFARIGKCLSCQNETCVAHRILKLAFIS